MATIGFLAKARFREGGGARERMGRAAGGQWGVQETGPNFEAAAGRALPKAAQATSGLQCLPTQLPEGLAPAYPRSILASPGF